MRRSRNSLPLLALLILVGCTASGTLVRREGADPGEATPLMAETGIFVGWPGGGTERRLPGAFLPSAWWETTPEKLVVPGEITQVVRPLRRGAGPGTRRPPPLLNPRPSQDPLRGWARRPPDPLVVEQAQQLYRRKLAEAQARYPNSEGYQEHHAVPIYLGGEGSGTTYRLPTAYHKAITQAFRQRWPYGLRKPDPQKRFELLMEVYAEYPIPQLIGIQP